MSRSSTLTKDSGSIPGVWSKDKPRAWSHTYTFKDLEADGLYHSYRVKIVGHSSVLVNNHDSRKNLYFLGNFVVCVIKWKLTGLRYKSKDSASLPVDVHHDQAYFRNKENLRTIARYFLDIWWKPGAKGRVTVRQAQSQVDFRD